MVAVTYGAARILTSPRAAKERNLAQLSGKGFFARMYEALLEARMQQANREIALRPHLTGWASTIEPVETKELSFGR